MQSPQDTTGPKRLCRADLDSLRISGGWEEDAGIDYYDDGDDGAADPVSQEPHPADVQRLRPQIHRIQEPVDIHPVDALARSPMFFVWRLPGSGGGYVMPTCKGGKGKTKDPIISVSRLAVVGIRGVAV